MVIQATLFNGAQSLKFGIFSKIFQNNLSLEDFSATNKIILYLLWYYLTVVYFYALGHLSKTNVEACRTKRKSPFVS